MRSPIIAAAALLAAGCAQGPQVAGQTPPTVSYRHEMGESRAATQQAMAYCDSYGRDAVLVREGRDDNEFVSVFECQ